MDLIGFGKSDKPDLEYRFFDHVKYVEGFIDALGLKNITLVIHDWGFGLGFHYAMRNQDNIKGLAFMEAILSTWKYEDMPPQIVEFFQTMRGTSSRELLVDQNFFVEQGDAHGRPSRAFRRLDGQLQKAVPGPDFSRTRLALAPRGPD